MSESLGGLARGFLRKRWSWPLLVGALTLPLLVVPPTAGSPPPPPAAACANEIACENQLPGTDPAIWDISGAGDDSIQGFATDISVNRGTRVDFKIKTDATSYRIEIYRSGYYQGLGARLVDTIESVPGQTQPTCVSDVATRLFDCGNWAVSASWDVPSTAVSGVYFARLIRASGDSHIPFIVRDDASHSDLVFQTSDTTWHAYNRYGGSDYYSNPRAFKLSYNRPINTRSQVPWGRDYYFANEFPMVRFLERNGYDVSYIAGPDTDRHGSLLRNHKTFLSVGHDEYWSGPQRDNVVAARDAGVNLMFLSGNEMYWRVRWENDYRTMTSYKETWSPNNPDQPGGKIDPSPEWTGTFRDPRFAPQSAGAGIPENAVTGTAFMANRAELAVTVNAREGRLRLWRNTDLAGLSPGTSRALTPLTVGYEADEDLDNGFRPPGLIRLSTTSGEGEMLKDFGNTVGPGNLTHHLTMYRAASGALVFGAGTVQWSWGLDATHDFAFGPPAPDPAMQQAQVNLLADMGAQPTSLMAGLAPAAASTDTVGPTVTITSPDGSHPNGARVTIEGTAEDAGGGQVAGVEVSTDRGATWHPAQGTNNWSYSYIQHGYGARPVRVRAVDDSANIGPGRARFPQVTCPCSIFGDEVPVNPAVADTSGTELGLRFVPMRDGKVTGVRFYKGPDNGGTHVGSLWSEAGVKLADVTFTNETAAGWQQATFPAPVSVQKGQTYVVSYTAPQGHYAWLPDAFELSGVEADPLSVLGGFGPADSGRYSSPGSFPNSTVDGRNSNYYVDVLFAPDGPPDPSPTLAVTSQQPSPGATGVPTTTAVAVSFSAPIEPGASFGSSQASTAIAGSVATSGDRRTLTFTPATPLPAQAEVTATLTGVTSVDGVDLAPTSWSFTTAAGPAGPTPTGAPTPTAAPTPTGAPTTPGTDPDGPSTRTATLFDSLAPKGRPTSGKGIEVGVEFTPTTGGSVVSIRYYRVRGQTAPKSVTLWSAKGKKLARTKLSAKQVRSKKTGWRTVLLDDPISLRAGRSYVASYYLPAGRSARTPGFFKQKVWKSGPLRAKRSDNGRYIYSKRSTFPDRVARGVNFYADVRFDY